MSIWYNLVVNFESFQLSDNPFAASHRNCLGDVNTILNYRIFSNSVQWKRKMLGTVTGSVTPF